MSGAGAGPIQFDNFELDRDTGTLRRNGLAVKIQPQPFRVLSAILDRPGDIISRDELRTRIWGDATFVEFDQGLNYCIRQIRLALGDSAAEPRYIETLPKQGYRFIATVTSGANTANGSEASGPGSISNLRKTSQKNIWFSAGAAAALLVTAVLAANWKHEPPTGLWTVKRTSPLTSYPGTQSEGTLSPDGERVAFSWEGRKGGHRGIYVLQVGEQTPLQLTRGESDRDAGDDSVPAWSADGRQIAFLRRYDSNHAEVAVVPALGGQVRKFEALVGSLWGLHPYPLLAWTADSRNILFTLDIEGTYSHKLNLLSLETGLTRPFPLEGDRFGVSSPSFSPDGHWLVFAQQVSLNRHNLMLQELGPEVRLKGEPRTVVEGLSAGDASWSPDSKRIAFVNNWQLYEWEMGGTARPVAPMGPYYTMYRSTVWGRDGHPRSVSAGVTENEDIWMLPLDRATHSKAGPPVSWAASTKSENMPQLSPDGLRGVFISARTGASEVWIADANGDNPRQLSHLAARITGFPSWSPDSKRVAFHSRDLARFGGEAWIYIVGADGGVPKPLAPGMAPAWSRDARYIFATSVKGGQIIRIRVDNGRMEPLFAGDGTHLTPDGKRILYQKGHSIFRRSLEGDAAHNIEERLVDDYGKVLGKGFFPEDNGVYYIAITSKGPMLRFYDDALRASKDIAAVPPGVGTGLTVSPDQSSLLYVADTNSNGKTGLVLTEFQ